MVSNVTSLTGNGLKDWLIQRVTAVYLLIYTLAIVLFLFAHPHLNYAQWHGLFTGIVFKIATILALLTISLHAWIGLWTVSTDYIKCSVIRLSTQLIISLWLLSQFIWGLMIVWGQ